MIKGVFLDLGWTLLRPVCNDWFINQKFLDFVSTDKISSIPTEKWNAVFNKGIKYLDDNHYVENEDEELIQYIEFYTILAKKLPELGLSEKQAKEIAEFRTYDISQYEFFPKARENVLKLKEKYKVGIISDTWPSVERLLQKGNIADLFDCKTYSFQLGTFKPDRRMYEDALLKMGLPAEQTVFVDDFEGNLDGAAKCGIHGVLIKTKEQYSVCDPDSGRYPSINAIEELPELLNKM